MIVGSLLGDVLEELRVFESNGDLLCEGLQTRLVLLCESSTFLVECLCTPNAVTVFVDDRHAQYRTGEVPCLLVKTWIEPEISVRVGDVDCLTALENGTSDARVIWQADLSNSLAHSDPRE